jgi:hypothetical protein
LKKTRLGQSCITDREMHKVSTVSFFSRFPISNQSRAAS